MPSDRKDGMGVIGIGREGERETERERETETETEKEKDREKRKKEEDFGEHLKIIKRKRTEVIRYSNKIHLCNSVSTDQKIKKQNSG